MEFPLRRKIFQINDPRTFREAALEVFRFQAAANPVYREFIAGIGVDPGDVSGPDRIPFLPVEFFKTRRVLCEGKEPEITFESSGTSGSGSARHYVADLSLYHRSLKMCFTRYYGPPGEYCILALLPSYLERGGSSLVYMADHLLSRSDHPDSGFYLNRLDILADILRRRKRDRQPTLLLGVSFALLDLAEQYPMETGPCLTLMETGGMKGRRRELVREELHAILKGAFHLPVIHSEYGMTELLSQAYSAGDGIFRCPPWMRVLIRDPNDPLAILQPSGKSPVSGGINIIDLANIYSCSFLATGDLGRLHPGGTFEVVGRFDHSDVRGCNLMVS